MPRQKIQSIVNGFDWNVILGHGVFWVILEKTRGQIALQLVDGAQSLFLDPLDRFGVQRRVGFRPLAIGFDDIVADGRVLAAAFVAALLVSRPIQPLI